MSTIQIHSGVLNVKNTDTTEGLVPGKEQVLNNRSMAMPTMTVANTPQSEVTPATKPRPQSKKGIPPSPNPVMKPPTSQRVQCMLDLSQPSPPLKRGDKNPIIAENKFNILGEILNESSMDYDDLDDLGNDPPGTLSE